MDTSRASTAINCPTCGKTISRKADLPRHMKTHSTNFEEELMHTCPYVGCSYRALQRSNLMTHLNVHSRERPNKCPAEGCEFSTTDPGSLTRHRKKRHDYEPKGNSSGSHPTAEPRKAARKRRRNTPYTTTFSPSVSTRSVPTDPSSPSSSILLSDDHVEESGKNASSAYSTKLITKRAQVNDSHLAPNPRPENALLHSRLSTASEAPAAEHPHAQLPVPEREKLPAVGAVSEVFVSKEILDNFLARFNDWQSPASSLPTPMVSYSVENIPVPVPTRTTLPPYTIHDAYIPTPAALPPYAVNSASLPTSASLPPYAVDDAYIPVPASLPPHAVDNAYPYIPALLPPYYNAPIPAPAFLPPYAVNNAPPSASQPSYEVQSIVDNAPYEYCYTSFDAQWSQPDFAIPDMGVYPRAIYPQDVNQGYCYTSQTGTNNFAMHGLYVN